jgi:hypothetical protein
MQTKTRMIINNNAAYGQEKLHVICNLVHITISIFGKKSVEVQQKILKNKINSVAI